MKDKTFCNGKNTKTKRTGLVNLNKCLNRIFQTIEMKSSVTRMIDGLELAHSTIFTVSNNFLVTHSGTADMENSRGTLQMIKSIS